MRDVLLQACSPAEIITGSIASRCACRRRTAARGALLQRCCCCCRCSLLLLRVVGSSIEEEESCRGSVKACNRKAIGSALNMAAAGSLKFKVEYFDLKDGQTKTFVQSFSPSDLVSTVLQASAQHFSVNASEYNLCGDQGRTEAFVPSTTLESNRLQNGKSGKKLYLGKVTAAATRFLPEASLSGPFSLYFACRSEARSWSLRQPRPPRQRWSQRIHTHCLLLIL
jgi:hypothetical protein